MSTEVTIGMMNEVIALFMGGSSIKEHGGKRYVYYPKSCAKDVAEMKYHTSWDWLMPVVQKVTDTHSQYTYFHAGHIYDELKDTIYAVDIVKAHLTVYKFITWYNEYQQKQTNDTTGTNKG